MQLTAVSLGRKTNHKYKEEVPCPLNAGFVNCQAISSLIVNSMPHIDGLKLGIDQIVRNSQREIGVCYALPHKHYEVETYEIIIAKKLGDSHFTYVDRISEATKEFEPCMWYPHDGKYYAVMFSATRLSRQLTTPKKFRADAGIMHPDYAYQWSEFTDTSLRRQTFVLNYKNPGLTPIVTVAWHIPASLPSVNSSQCFANCYSDGVGPHQVGPHEPIGVANPARPALKASIMKRQ